MADTLADRASRHARLSQEETREIEDRLRSRVADLLDSWQRVAAEKEAGRADLQYGTELQLPRLLYAPLDPELAKLTADARKFKANQSLRDVEANVNLWIMRPDGSYIAPQEEDE